MTSKQKAKRLESGALPSYKKPPVNEVVCGLRFAPLTELKVPHIGLLWERFRKDYPVIQHAAPLSTDQSILIDDSTGAPLPRIWFISAEDNELIQFQGDRFYFNWRHRTDEYPRYSKIIKKFAAAKNTLDTFLQDFRLDPLEPVEQELTYLNHIVIDQSSDTIDEIRKVFVDFNWQEKKGRFLPKPANCIWQVRFPLPDKQGWLQAKLSQGKRKTDGVPMLILDMSARGLPKDKSPTATNTWFDLAHRWIVCGFADLTTDEIQNSVWERENDRAS